MERKPSNCRRAGDDRDLELVQPRRANAKPTFHGETERGPPLHKRPLLTCLRIMRTTIDLPDSLLTQVRKIMAARQTTLKALVEEGLLRVVEESRGEHAPFELRDASLKGPAGFAEGSGPEDVARLLRDLNEARPPCAEDNRHSPHD